MLTCIMHMRLVLFGAVASANLTSCYCTANHHTHTPAGDSSTTTSCVALLAIALLAYNILLYTV
jgi:hypothetical protein